MPSAIEVHLCGSGVFFWFFKVHPKCNENSKIVKFCGKLLKVYKKYQNNSWHIQIVVSVGRSQKPRKSKMSQEGKRKRRGKRYILAFPATRKTKICKYAQNKAVFVSSSPVKFYFFANLNHYFGSAVVHCNPKARNQTSLTVLI